MARLIVCDRCDKKVPDEKSLSFIKFISRDQKELVREVCEQCWNEMWNDLNGGYKANKLKEEKDKVARWAVAEEVPRGR